MIHKEFFDNIPLEKFGELELCQFNGDISLVTIQNNERPVPMLKVSEQGETKVDAKEPAFFKSRKFTLVDLVELLNEKHLKAVLLDNKIYCNKKVIIHAESDTTLKIEGMICPEYYQVREIIYSKYYKI